MSKILPISIVLAGIVIVGFAGALLLDINVASAHSGGTAADGCHYCWTNCSYYGEVYGARHCHGGGTFTPYYPPTPIPTPSCPYNSRYDSLSGSCKCNYGYVADGSSCVSGNSYCWGKYGYNSSYDALSKSCECDYGYLFYNGTCVSRRTYCTRKYGYNAEWSYLHSSCTCRSGYVLEYGACVRDEDDEPIYFLPTPTRTPAPAPSKTYQQLCEEQYGSDAIYNPDDELCHYCNPGYTRINGICSPKPTPTPKPFTPAPTPVPIRSATPTPVVPAECGEGYAPSLDKLRCIKIPENAHRADNGTDVWLCDEGYDEVGNSCVLKESSDQPADAAADVAVEIQEDSTSFFRKVLETLKFWKWFDSSDDSSTSSSNPTPIQTIAPTFTPRPTPVRTPQQCHPSYSGCLRPNASDYDCAGGSGNGPYYTGTVRVIGPDVFGLDRDGDGIGCE